MENTTGKVDKRELHEHRLSTVSEDGKRVYIHPEEVTGRFKTRRTIVYWILLAIYIGLPWIRIDGKQQFLLNLPERKFVFFGSIFWGHDAIYIFFFLAFFVFGMALINAVWGRVWCGWACPQTIFIDLIYRQIDVLVEGPPHAQKALDAASWSGHKLIKRATKWFLYCVVSWIFANVFMTYFIDTRVFMGIITSSPILNQTAFIVMMVVFVIFLFNFGWFREQFCLIACPYGRFQSVFMDEHSLVVAYDTKRGEPRRGRVEKGQVQGDCINCFKCVLVCPTGIDIRRGTQFECITCTMCIDVCDKIMDKADKPRGLIRYTTEEQLEGRKVKHIRIRTVGYVFLMALIVLGFFVKTAKESQLKISVLRGKTPFQMVQMEGKEDQVVNHFRFAISNQMATRTKLYFVPDPESVRNGIRLVTPIIPFVINSQEKEEAIVFAEVPRSAFKRGHLSMKVKVISGLSAEKGRLETEKVLKLLGPED
ncbi:MAG: cytochrome c oxidase accessory protein CcoG [SAR324 cluster bacterium]|nr:cytochrome c oxidase accessory protein CcoG [SAR324 cluster bacterium]